jgi:hypothetical protein
MFSECSKCRYNLSPHEKRCPNCGRKNPASTFRKTTLEKWKTPSIFGFIFSIIITSLSFLILIENPPKDYPLLILVFIISFFLSTIMIYLLAKDRFKIEYQQYVENPLTDLDRKEKIIKRRISELAKRLKQIDLVLDRIKQNDTPQLQETRKKLLLAREIVTGQYARYELQAKKIEIARLQNTVLPFLDNLHRLNEFETENGLITIENTKSEVEKIRQNLTNFYAIEFPKAVQTEKNNFLTQLAETKDSCDKLREALLSKQAAHALRGISPIGENINAQNSKEIAHAVETFNIQSTLTDFSESFEELENEYRRLRSENDVGKKLLNENS